MYSSSKMSAISTCTGKPVAVQKMVDKVALINDAAVFVCAANGWPRPTYTWFKDGKTLDLTSNNIQLRKEQNAQHLMILHVGYSDAGRYKCRVSNSLGSVELSSKLEVVKELSGKPDPPGNLILEILVQEYFSASVTLPYIMKLRRRAN